MLSGLGYVGYKKKKNQTTARRRRPRSAEMINFGRPAEEQREMQPVIPPTRVRDENDDEYREQDLQVPIEVHAK